MSSPLLEISGLTVRYRCAHGTAQPAVDGISLTIRGAEVVGVLGESGSGKSTLAAAILQVLPAGAECRGEIVFEGRNLVGAKEKELRAVRGKRISLIPQDPAVCLNPVLRVGTQISEVMRAHLPLSRSERRDFVRELLAEVGFRDAARVESSYPHQLSGGERQRVVIAQAIACRPALIVADESTSKLDPPLQREILLLMSRIVSQHAAALLWITHNPASLAGFADRVVVMHAGKIVEESETREILTCPTHTYTRTLMEDARKLSLEFAGMAEL